ncbi:MerR family transcriptional regulator [Streptomyces triticirhizae]|uniref:DNA-binding protein n=1 Tax=Streptomyces triticirhizae TaxID=2483353 RepID=A0A3M2M4H1_9ACTN|nr:hypothetical protein [Streptomyces triticirhizae]RMI44456.1 hypothetical protein EBN88_05495 [Streptomyces triticirhizae]
MPRKTTTASTTTAADQQADDVPARLLTPQETADRLGVRLKTLQNWAPAWEVNRVGPKPHRLRPGRGWVRYEEAEVARIVRDTLAGKQPLTPGS